MGIPCAYQKSYTIPYRTWRRYALTWATGLHKHWSWPPPATIGFSNIICTSDYIQSEVLVFFPARWITAPSVPSWVMNWYMLLMEKVNTKSKKGKLTRWIYICFASTWKQIVKPPNNNRVTWYWTGWVKTKQNEETGDIPVVTSTGALFIWQGVSTARTASCWTGGVRTAPMRLRVAGLASSDARRNTNYRDRIWAQTQPSTRPSPI